MLNIENLIENEISNGYGDINARAKVCQDIILKAISTGSLNKNVTIKGGVVMRSKTNNIRRATQDLDIDFDDEGASLLINSIDFAKYFFNNILHIDSVLYSMTML